jgi:PIN domain nuclease of toxin-antitoxin system
VIVLLDTHVWLWSVDGDARRIGRRARLRLVRAEADDAIRVSPASVFEVAALYTHGRVRLSRAPEQWIHDALDAAGLRVAEFSPEMAIDAGLIPRAMLPDPLDRLLVATARYLDATLLTADARILEYARHTRRVQVQDAGT